MMPLSIDLSLVRAWAIQFNRAHREASINASMWRLRFAAAFIFSALVFLAGRALAETNADVPTGKPNAVIDRAALFQLVSDQHHDPSERKRRRCCERHSGFRDFH